jgi:hypothetical protein
MIELSNKNTGKSTTMAEKKLTDLKEFIDSVNIKNKDHNGKATRLLLLIKRESI